MNREQLINYGMTINIGWGLLCIGLVLGGLYFLALVS